MKFDIVIIHAHEGVWESCQRYGSVIAFDVTRAVAMRRCNITWNYRSFLLVTTLMFLHVIERWPSLFLYVLGVAAVHMQSQSSILRAVAKLLYNP